jgi:predicted neutral ceramidase superfamily lipid hydrolase
MIFGLSFFGTTWIIISIILGVILLFLLGIFYDEDIDGDGLIVLKALAAILLCIFWPFFILIAVCVGVVAIPIYLGKKIRNFMAQRKEKKIEKENFFKQLEESNKKGG